MHGAGAFDQHQLLINADPRLFDRYPDPVQCLHRSGLAVLLQPQPLAQHLLQRRADGFVFITGDGFDFGFRGTQSRFEGIGGVQ